jgi:ABC-type transporter Mla MlaB component
MISFSAVDHLDLAARRRHGVARSLRSCNGRRSDSASVDHHQEVGLLRISRVVDRSSWTTLRVEGRIVAEWVSVLERECQLALQEKRPVRLDLSGVTFIDCRGVAALRQFDGNDLEIINCAEFIRELLRTP